MSTARFDAGVVGGGMIGLACACLFARRGLRVAVIEARALDEKTFDAHAKSDARVSAINFAAQNMLRAAGVWTQVTPHAHAYRAMKVWDCNSTAKISFDAAEIMQTRLGYIADNRAIVSALLARLQNYEHVEIFDCAKLEQIETSASSVRLFLPHAQVETRLLIGADGANSRVRELAGIKTRRNDSGEDAVIATLTTERGHGDTAWQCFCGHGTLAMLPLAENDCALVWSCARARAAELMQLTPQDFCAQVQTWFADTLGEIRNCRARGRFALIRHHAESYIAPRIALAGDAAHCIHPLAGLGANLGFIDAAALDESAQGGRDPGRHAALRRYMRRRRGENTAAFLLMETINRLFASRNPAAQFARAAGMNMTAALPPLKNALAKFAAGAAGDLPQTCRARRAG